MSRPEPRQIRIMLVAALASLTAATFAVWFLDSYLGLPNASSVYIVAVVFTAYLSGPIGAVVAAVGAFLLYDFLFTEPRYTLVIHDPGSLLNAVLLLFVGVVVGQLAALQRTRAEVAQAREREARALFRLSHALATRASTTAVLPQVASILQAETGMERLWISLGPDDASERVAADTGDGRPPTPAGLSSELGRTHGDEPADWIRLHQPRSRSRMGRGPECYRVRIEADGAASGSIWATRPRAAGDPDRTETRLLATAASQVGQALAKDRLTAASQAAEIARQSDALQSALLQSVSHDLRTPLATIRAAADSLRPDGGLTLAEQEESAAAIAREVSYLDRLVTNLLDMSRIEAGALRVERDVFELDDLVGQSLDRLHWRMADRPVRVELDAPPVEVDATFLDQVVTNVIENALKYTPAGTPLSVHAAASGTDAVRLTIEDAGPGVPDDAIPRLFDKFYRVPGRPRGSRSGTGIGLAVVRGLVEAMGGRVRARRSDLGGLAIDIDLPAATVPADIASVASA